MGNNPAQHHFGIGDNYPLYFVSWDDIQGFEERLEEGFRLPSEAEWEYACRAGHDETRFLWGNNNDQLGDYAWYVHNSDSRTHEVGQKEPNPWGLHDIHGNVYEWCEDVWHDDYNGAPDDGEAWMQGGGQNFCLLRGGSWTDLPSNCRSANRSRDERDTRLPIIGFRLVWSRD